MVDEKRKIVEQHVAGAAAKDDAEGNPEDEVVELHRRDRRRAAPQFLASDQRARIDPSDHDAADIGQRIPSDRERSDRDGDRIKKKKKKNKEKQQTHRHKKRKRTLRRR